jgi:hypothetical protein
VRNVELAGCMLCVGWRIEGFQTNVKGANVSGSFSNIQGEKITLSTCAGCYRGVLEGRGVLGKADVRRGAGCSCYVLKVRMLCMIYPNYQLLRRPRGRTTLG